MEPEAQNNDARNKRLQEDMQRRLDILSQRVNKETEKRRQREEYESDSHPSVFSAEEDDRGPGGKTPSRKRKDRASASSGRGATKRGKDTGLTGKDASSGAGRAGKDTSSGAPRKQLTTSQTFPKADWPPGYSKDQVDNLTTQQVLDMKAMRMKEAPKGGASKQLPGWKTMECNVVIPIELIKGGSDDATSVFTPGRWRRFPISEIKKWWCKIPLEWGIVVPEFGVDERGMANRIPLETWEGAHDRTRWWELRHWGSINAQVRKFCLIFSLWD